MKRFSLEFFVILSLVGIFWVLALKYYYEKEYTKKLDKVLYEAEKNIVGQLDVITKEKVDIINQKIQKFAEEQDYDMFVIYDKGFDGKVFTQKENIPNNILKSFKEEELDYSIVKNSTKIMVDNKTGDYYASYYSVRKRPIETIVKVLIKLDETQKKQLEDNSLKVIIVSVTTSMLIGVFAFIVVYRQYKRLIQKEKDLVSANIDILNVLGNAVSKRDSDTDEHNYRVTIYSVQLAKKIGLNDSKIRALIKGAFLHDVGKIGIEDSILLKSTKLTDKEFEQMKQHVDIGVDIVKDIVWLSGAINVIYGHHEKYDGTGYPKRLKKEQIPIEARVFSIIDVFDALTSNRPYKKAFSYEKSLEIIKKDSGSHFDPRIVKVFEKNIYEMYEKISKKNRKELEDILHKTIEPYFNDI